MTRVPITGDRPGITADELQHITLRLANACWCRYWLHWNYPVQGPWLMALSCHESDGSPSDLELESEGFTRVDYEGLLIYTVPRVDDAGSPFRSRLY
jgi:hypothetical protein